MIICVSNNFQIKDNSLQIRDLYRKITDLEDNHYSNNIGSENQPLQRQPRLFVDSTRQLKVDYLNGTIASLYDLNELKVSRVSKVSKVSKSKGDEQVSSN